MSSQNKEIIQDEIHRRLNKLTQWARVVVLTRNVRRMKPLIENSSSDELAPLLRAMEEAISVAEHAATNGKGLTDTEVGVVIGNTGAYKGANSSVHDVIGFMVYAISCAGSNFPDVFQWTFSKASEIYKLHPVAKDVLRSDLALLEALAFEENWTDETPVPPEIFGPLWPDGAPEGWPAETCEDTQLVLEIDVPDDATDEQIEQHVRRITRGMDGLNRSFGGNGLRVSEIEIERPASVPVGVPS